MFNGHLCVVDEFTEEGMGGEHHRARCETCPWCTTGSLDWCWGQAGHHSTLTHYTRELAALEGHELRSPAMVTVPVRTGVGA